MSAIYNPKQYWENRLTEHFDLQGVGRIGFGKSYNTWLYRRKRRCIASCFAAINLEGKTVFDVGCGTGFFIEWFLQQGAIVSGIDITELSIRKLRTRYRCNLFRQDISAEGYVPPRLFDIVNMWDVIYHIVEPDAFGRACRNISRSLNDGGFFLFTGWLGRASDIRLADHVQGRCLTTYKLTLPSLGFELIRVLPLYTALNTTRFRPFTDRLGMPLYVFDNLWRRISRHNLSLAVWRYHGQGKSAQAFASSSGH
jgi:SAM-dependent methyltransferase